MLMIFVYQTRARERPIASCVMALVVVNATLIDRSFHNSTEVDTTRQSLINASHASAPGHAASRQPTPRVVMMFERRQVPHDVVYVDAVRSCSM